ncbi:Threonine/homoserine/homoserine lactone efflux protein [Loktanella fryxellensis]|uniref:Threonine/homoserine/homoserine lactone efflux protein n=1 Tax=Loktanella fryxellensis TaxID=245187 RepID=A0A1H7YMA6_9RHOB|nr:LysE family transporter [Loktanella fryxellensis]SEM46428.1 Threonine/homoserine/homoserine lactone efflux protein [Loktanella fryxellensis]
MTWAAFASVVLIHLAAAISPGPAFVVALRVAAAEGFRVAAALALGYGIGAMLWAGAALAGLALVFTLVPALFVALKIGGAAFLLWLAVRMWRHAADPLPQAVVTAAPRSVGQAVRLGVLTFASNPKTAVFFGAVFATLIPVDTPTGWKLAILLAVGLNETLWYLVVARVFSWPRPRAAYARAKTWIDRGFGTLLALLGLKIALT